MICLLRTIRPFSIPAAIALCLAALPVGAQTPPPVEHASPSDHASAYYNYSMGHLYAEMAQAYNRTDYVNKAIDFYRLALKEDPSISFITEELTDLYIQSGQLNKAVTEAEDLLKQNPDDLGARRILGRVYTRLIGDPQAGKLDEKMLHLAIEQYTKIAEKDPEDLDSQLLLARLDRLAHDTVSAEKVYKDILAKESDNDEALTGLAAIFSDRGDTKNAIDMLKRASESNPGARTLVMLASLYEQANDYSSAADAWERALQLAPENDRWKRALAQDLLYANRIDDAQKLYEGIAADDPKDSQIQLRLAEIFLQKRDFVKARKALDAAKEGDSGSLEVKFEEVMLLDAEGKSDDAIKALKALIDDTAKTEYTSAERAQRNRLVENLGMLYRTAGKYPQAIASFKEIESDDPEISARAAIQVVETWREAKDMPAARKEADAALKKFPKDRIVVVEHATLLADSGKVDEAIAEIDALKDGKNDRKILLSEAQIYDKAKRFSDEQRVLDGAQKLSAEKAEVIEVRFARGAMLERMKDFEGSEGEFRAILKDDPANAGALNYLGYMLADRNTKLDEAQQLIAKALELDPQNGAYLDSLGWVYYRQNRLDAAEDQLRRALDKMGNDPTVHDHLGDVLLKQGKVKEAIAQWQSSLKNYDANPAGSDVDPADMAKVQRKLEDARVRIAQQAHGAEAH
jgi:tetratricopeptide (TPR) repeat protein